MPVAGLPISTSPIGFGERVADSSESAPARRSTPLYRRRSVSSMKGLLPLTLPSSCSGSSSSSSSRSHLPLEEDMGQRVADCLPEVLARDLELSKAIFEARSMTAGTPIPTITSDCMSKSRSLVYPHSISSPSSYQSALTHVQSLGAIEERSSRVSFLDRQEALKSDDMASDLDSLPGSEASSVYDAEPPSFRMREQSIVTNATSLESTHWRPSSKCSGPLCESSWIDADSDGDEEEDVCDYDIASRLSPRPQTPPEADLDLDARLNQAELREARNMNSFSHRKSHSVCGGAPLSSLRRQHSGHSVPDTWRSPSTQPRETDSRPPSFSLHRAALARYQQSRRLPVQTDKIRGVEHVVSKVPSKSHNAESTPVSEPGDGFMFAMESRPGSVYVRPCQPPSPLPSVQAWLNESGQPYALSFPMDELARVVPLPPDVIETLRVSTACFPETMLLSSSLTIETIRSYSKKVRRPSIDSTQVAPPQSPAPPTKKSLWRRVVGKGSQPPGQRPQDSHSCIAGNLQSPSSSSLEAPKPWAPLKNVFGCCSDYICDALYAHIIAYNYISALVARNPPLPTHGRSRTMTSMDQQREDIPKKAASLLGLNNTTPSLGSGASSRAVKRLSSSLPSWAKDEMMSSNQPATPTNHDVAVRSIQTELLVCIRRLIATARLMAESGSGEETTADMEAQDTDIMFMRSLCELVRISEEATYA